MALLWPDPIVRQKGRSSRRGASGHARFKVLAGGSAEHEAASDQAKEEMKTPLRSGGAHSEGHNHGVILITFF